MNITEEHFLNFFNENSNESNVSIDIVIGLIDKIDPVYKYSFGRWVINKFPIFKDSIIEILDSASKVDVYSEQTDVKKNALIWIQCRKFNQEKSLRMQLVLLYDDVLFIRDPLVWYFNRKDTQTSLSVSDRQSGMKVKYSDINLEKLFEKIPVGMGIALDSKIITSEKAEKIANKFQLA